MSATPPKDSRSIADYASFFRFLAGHAPTRSLAALLIDRAPADIAGELRDIVARRRLRR